MMMAKTTINTSSTTKSERVILVVGACGLDRLISVPNYPQADAKVLTSGYHEYGGGNAANTACAIARLTNANCFQDDGKRIIVKLLTKIGNDDIGERIQKELIDFGVDISSPLFCVGNCNNNNNNNVNNQQSKPTTTTETITTTTTSFCTIVVSELEHTRTCFFTPGSCGQLLIEDVKLVDMNKVFENVIHVHSDSRCTEAALMIAKEARKRNIPVSVDVEKQRQLKAFDELLQISTMVFTNGEQINACLQNLSNDTTTQQGVVVKQSATKKKLEIKATTTTIMDGSCPDVSLKHDKDFLAESFIEATRPNWYFARWHNQIGSEKEFIVTRGSLGSLHVQCTTIEKVDPDQDNVKDTQYQITTKEGNNNNNINHVIIHQDCIEEHYLMSNNNTTTTITQQRFKASYTIQSAGVLTNVNIVDTTGAGDVYIGGYILAKYGLQFTNVDHNDITRTCMNFATWVAGKKLQGPGARAALPTVKDVNENLGATIEDVTNKLQKELSNFGQR